MTQQSAPEPAQTAGNECPAADQYVPQDQPAFIVGVTGHMDPTDQERLTEQVKQLFRFLRHGAGKGGDSESSSSPSAAEAANELKQALAPLVPSDSDASSATGEDPAGAYDRFFDQWPGLGRTPIIVLSSLAPGADQIVAKVALDPEFADDGFRLLCPLPVPLRQYRIASTFVRQPKDDATDEERQKMEAENQARLADLEKIVPDDDDPRCFPVAVRNQCSPGDPIESLAGVSLEEQLELLRDELELSEDQRNRLYQFDLQDDNRKRRHRRYQAAGEYIAAYSHLMIAIWDHVDDTKNTEGTAAIVHARRTGLTPGLLATTHHLSLPPDGATLHIYTKRQKRADAETQRTKKGSDPNGVQSSGEPTHDPDWTLRWLFARTRREHHARSSESAAADGTAQQFDNLDAAWQDAGLTQLRRTAKLLRECAERKQVEPKRAQEHLKTFLTHNGICVFDRLRQSGSPLFGMVQRVADFRRRAADEQRNTDLKQANRPRARLFWLTLLAAVLLHGFHHWHSQAHEAAHAGTHAGGHADVAEPSGGQKDENQHFSGAAEKPPDWVIFLDRLLTSLIGLAGAGFAVAALLYFRKRRPPQHDEKANDLRAIAEGARVQLMWHMAGLGTSVSANYMSRQRGELSWVRRTIRSVAMPYEQARWYFDRLAPEMQIEVLKCVAYNWLRGHKTNAQSNYFRDARETMVERIHFWHKTGSVLALAGLAVGMLYVLDALGAVAGLHLLDAVSAAAWRMGLCCLLAVPVLAGAALLVSRLEFGSWESFRKQYLDSCLKHLVPTRESHLLGATARRFGQQMTRNFVRFLMPALVVAAFTLLLAIFLSNLTHLFPGAASFSNLALLLPGIGPWVIILSAWLLIAGGLALAWPERNLWSEMAYQYTTMENLFEIAANRLEPMIAELERLHRLSSDRTAAETEASRLWAQIPDTDERAAFDLSASANEIQSDAAAEYLQQLRRIQRALYELGTEALDENAEWLILHRARPLEPLMAG